MFERFTLLQSVLLTVNEPVNVNFSIKYMNHFAKATSLSNKVCFVSVRIAFYGL